MFHKAFLTTAAALSLSVALVGSAMAKSDEAFLEDAIKGDNSEVTLGKLAADQGSSEEVRSFGETLAKDHGSAKDEVMAVAKEMGVTPPDGIKDEAKEELDKLKDLSGDEFDREFASYMVKDHKKDIAEFQEKADEGDGTVPKLAAKTIPTLKKHLEIAQSIAQ